MFLAEVVADTAEEVKANWEAIKAAERGTTPDSALHGVPAGMPALERAAKVQRKAATVGFDWPSTKGVFAKVAEELQEVEAAGSDSNATAAEIGDLLFAVVNLARHLHVDPELALTGSIQRFTSRFVAMEKVGPLDGLSLADLDARWEEAKRSVQTPPLT